MVLPYESLPWQCDDQEVFVPVTFEGEFIGVLKPEYAQRLVDVLNNEQYHQRALQLACAELVRRSQGRLGTVESLVEEYTEQSKVPRFGTPAIALLLRHRQEELGVTDKEFMQFCDSYRLSPEKLQAIYEGYYDIDSTLFAPLARILGQPIEEVIHIVQG
jgi:hypothetical protein